METEENCFWLWYVKDVSIPQGTPENREAGQQLDKWFKTQVEVDRFILSDPYAMASITAGRYELLILPAASFPETSGSF